MGCFGVYPGSTRPIGEGYAGNLEEQKAQDGLLLFVPCCRSLFNPGSTLLGSYLVQEAVAQRTRILALGSLTFHMDQNGKTIRSDSVPVHSSR